MLKSTNVKATNINKELANRLSVLTFTFVVTLLNLALLNLGKCQSEH